MRIAIVSSLFPPFGIGGAEQVASSLALALRDLGNQVDVISTCNHAGLGNGRYRIDSWEGVRVWRVAPWNVYWRFDRETARPNRLLRAAWHAVDLWNPSVVAPLNEVLATIRPEVINTHNIDGLSPAVWGVARRYTRALVHTLHDYHLLCPRAVMQRSDGTVCAQLCRFCRVYARYHRRFQQSVAVLVSPSAATADLHRRSGWTAPRMEVIRNAVEIRPAPLRDVPPNEPLRALFLSRFEREKGCDTLVEAIRLLRDSAEIQFDLAGKGSYEQRLAQLAHEMPNVFWHGYVSGTGKDELFAASDVFLQLSECPENAPLGLTEAGRHGLYLVGTNMGGIPELINDEEYGQLIPPGDSERLSRALLLLAGRRDALRRSRSLRLSRGSEYGHREMAEQYLGIFRSLLALPR